MAEQMDANKVNFIISFNKKQHEIITRTGVDPNEKLKDLRQTIYKLTEVAPPLQKLMFKGILKDEDKTVQELGIKEGTKIMMIGSTISDVMNASAPTEATTQVKEGESFYTTSAHTYPEDNSESLSEKMPHKKIIAKGKPDEIEPALKGRNDPLPPAGLKGMLNNTGVKIRLTFKVFTQELWISSASNTQKINFSQIRGVTFEPIKGNEDYHIVALHLGSSDSSKYYIYWVPCQYTKAIRSTIMSRPCEFVR
ncbi:hypothetical protein PROFUN_10433 [Planoprotostelium fungivorum]|uniref:Ubiquitin-like domain-containing protein n=1 Tax=Planoprotostelium fungivorum TaxID=1890364 RepID=A0A2P6NE11_9EUKA|nr:hypothetical protein PROFUN_10433 [Planoprotostelium fungivorum]